MITVNCDICGAVIIQTNRDISFDIIFSLKLLHPSLNQICKKCKEAYNCINLERLVKRATLVNRSDLWEEGDNMDDVETRVDVMLSKREAGDAGN